MGSWIEGRLTKFIAGDEDQAAPPKAEPVKGAPVGPFSHFSTISPSPSGEVSRSQSTVDFGQNLNLSAGASRGTSPSIPQATPFGHGDAGGFAPAMFVDSAEDDDGQFVNPMAQHLAPPANNYAPVSQRNESADDDDLGFGNSSLSRSRTPKTGPDSKTEGSAKKEEVKPTQVPKAETAPASPGAGQYTLLDAFLHTAGQELMRSCGKVWLARPMVGQEGG